jgi:hypothetical protein
MNRFEFFVAMAAVAGPIACATVVGDQLPTTQCRVTGSRSASFLNSSAQTPVAAFCST